MPNSLRPSPSVSATSVAEGTKKKGNDGSMWVVKKAVTGVPRWTRASRKPTSKTELGKTMKKMMKRLLATKREKKHRMVRLLYRRARGTDNPGLYFVMDHTKQLASWRNAGSRQKLLRAKKAKR